MKNKSVLKSLPQEDRDRIISLCANHTYEQVLEIRPSSFRLLHPCIPAPSTSSPFQSFDTDVKNARISESNSTLFNESQLQKVGSAGFQTCRIARFPNRHHPLRQPSIPQRFFRKTPTEPSPNARNFTLFQIVSLFTTKIGSNKRWL